MIALTSFASDPFAAAQLSLAQDALQSGAQRLSLWRRRDLERTAFYRANRDILDQPRGAGYWLWKPYIILSELERLQQGDFLFYSDCGQPDKPHRISRPLHVLADWCKSNVGGMLPGVYIPKSGRNAKWTKGECFSVMGCDSDLFRDHPQIQTTFSVWEKHDESLDFVQAWLDWCTVPAAISDGRVDPSIPDAPDFRDHRHDQSILTLLALKRGLRCYGSPLEGHGGSKGIDNLIDRISGQLPADSYAHKFPRLLDISAKV